MNSLYNLFIYNRLICIVVTDAVRGVSNLKSIANRCKTTHISYLIQSDKKDNNPVNENNSGKSI